MSLIAIVAFGMPPKMLVPISWGIAAVHLTLKSRVDRGLGRR
jgi:hypothetical protein